MADIYIIDIDEAIGTECYERLYHCVSEERKDKINKYRFRADAKRSLYADILVRYLACSKLHIRNEEVHFEESKYGKPFLRNAVNQFFNVSHSGKWVVCGWSNHEIGIDIQKIEDISIDVAKEFFCTTEYLSIIHCKSTAEQKNQFYNLWTLKESYIKYKGKGLAIPLDSFQLSIINNEIFLQSDDAIKPVFYKIDVDEEHKLAVCTRDTEISSINRITLDSLCTILI